MPSEFGVPASAGEGAERHPEGWTPNLRDSDLPHRRRRDRKNRRAAHPQVG